jgi:hypothetical protein
MPYETLELLLHERRTLIVFDGLDELPVRERDRARADVVAFCTAHPQAKVLVTSRPGASTAGFGASGFAQYGIASFSRSDVHRYLTRWASVTGMRPTMARRLLSDVTESATAEWLSNPLLVAQMAVVYERYHALPRNASELYRITYGLLFEGRETVRGVRRTSLPPRVLGELMCCLAYRFVTRPTGMGDMPGDEFLHVVEEELRRVVPGRFSTESEAQEVFRLLADSDYPVRQTSGGLAGEEPHWALVRDPFGQYLAARFIAARARSDGEVVESVKRAVHASGFVEGAVFVTELLGEDTLSDRVGPSSSVELLRSLRRELDKQTDPEVRRSIEEILRSAQAGRSR